MNIICNTKRESEIKDNMRDSGIELFRIISMLVIVAHHYVVNSGLLDLLHSATSINFNYIFLQLFGWGGKQELIAL